MKKILTLQPGHRFLSIDILRIDTNFILGSLQSVLISLKFLSVMGTIFVRNFYRRFLLTSNLKVKGT